MENISSKIHQRSICEHSGIAGIHLRSIFCLPSTIRLQIYVAAGLFSNRVIDMTRWRKNPFRPCIKDVRFSCNLLLTCRVVYAEASSVLYSTNQFILRYEKSGSLRLLQNLSKDALSSLAHLTVHLKDHDCESEIDYETDPDLISISGSDQAIIREWQSTASYVMAHIKPSTLQLHFVCDVADQDTAMQVLEPFLNVRTLASCAIRLGSHPDSLLRDLASKTATRAAGCPPYRSESPFRFLDLPPEIRRQVLEYTDLITPLCEVAWNPEKAFFLEYVLCICRGSKKCPPNLHNACQFRNCWRYSEYGCFCHRHHAAFSPHCRCWSPPTPLFLVCRALQEEAQAVFFMKNRFVVTPSTANTNPFESSPDRLEVSIFLMDVVPYSALQYLRFVEVIFHRFYYDERFRLFEPVWQDWARTIVHVREKLCLPALTLQLFIRCGDSGVLYDRKRCPMAFSKYERTVGSFSDFGGLHRFFVHLTWPFVRTPQGPPQPPIHSESEDRLIGDTERDLEQLVMGSEYDSRSLLNEEPYVSQWFVPP